MALRVLGLEAGATPEEVKGAWRDLAQVWHPDRFEANERLQEKAAGKLQEINAAYEALKSGGSGDRGIDKTDGTARPQAPPMPEGPVGTSRRPSLMVLALGKFRATGMMKVDRKRWWWPF